MEGFLGGCAHEFGICADGAGAGGGEVAYGAESE